MNGYGFGTFVQQEFYLPNADEYLKVLDEDAESMLEDELADTPNYEMASPCS